MADEKIQVRVTATGQTLDVVVFNKRLDSITVVIGEGVHNVRVDLTPTRNGMAYAGKALGREIVYERSREDVKSDLARAAGFRYPELAERCRADAETFCNHPAPTSQDELNQRIAAQGLITSAWDHLEQAIRQRTYNT